MRVSKLSILIAAAAVQVLPAAAIADTQEGRTPDPERRICRSNMDTTGTILGGRRVCRTAAEWRRQQENDRESYERARDDRSVRGERPGS